MSGNCVVTGWGMYVPERILTNGELERLVNTSDEWITDRTGIKQRRIAAPDEATASMAVRAGRAALEKAHVRGGDLDLIIVATCSPDYFIASTACLVQCELGASRAGVFDLQATCTGFVYGLSVARAMITSGAVKTVLLIGADALSRFVDWTDRGTCVLFGDGAGAVVLQNSNAAVGIESAVLHGDGSKYDLLYVPAGGSRLPATQETVDARRHFIKMNGPEVFKLAVRSMAEAADEAVREAGLTLNDIALVVPHQANLRIIEAVAKRLHLPMERFYVNVQRYGNSSAATIPIALVEAEETGKLQRGDKVLMVAFGGGFTWGASVMEWFGAPLAPEPLLQRIARKATAIRAFRDELG